jgi:hypothetical protein
MASYTHTALCPLCLLYLIFFKPELLVAQSPHQDGFVHPCKPNATHPSDDKKRVVVMLKRNLVNKKNQGERLIVL